MIRQKDVFRILVVGNLLIQTGLLATILIYFVYGGK
jgi:hypothetical protein